MDEYDEEMDDISCGICLDLGVVHCDEVDENGNVMKGVDTKACICQDYVYEPEIHD